jgi:mannosyltransferase OCH1-like enzyme
MIPRLIHYCWLSDDPYPDKTLACLESWKSHLSGYEFKKWDGNSFDIDSVAWAREAYGAKKYAFAADYIRFYALYNYGGIYLDTDVEVIKCFEPLLSGKSFMGFEYISIPEAAVIGSEPKIGWIKTCLDYYDGKSFYDRNGKEKTVAVPIMMRATLERLYKRPIFDNSQVQHLDDLDLYPYQFFSPKKPYEDKINISADTYCIHYSVGSWCGGCRTKINRYTHSILTTLLGKTRYDNLLYRYHLKKIISEL